MPFSPALPDLESARLGWGDLIAGLDPAVLQAQRWFQGRGGLTGRIEAADYAILNWPEPRELVALTILRAEVNGQNQAYFLPLILLPERPDLPLLGTLTIGGEKYALAEASHSRRVSTRLLDELKAGTVIEARRGRFVFHPINPGFVRHVTALAGDSSNTVLHLRRDEVQKIIRRLWPGITREIRLSQVLQECPFIPSIHGYLTYEADGITYTLALWQEYLPNKGSLWEAIVEGLAGTMRLAIAPAPLGGPGELLTQWLGTQARELDNLSEILARLHLSLAGIGPPRAFDLQDLQRIVARTGHDLDEGRKIITADPPGIWEQAADLLAHLSGRLCQAESRGQCIETHGDFHLDQILLTGAGLMITDLEGEPLLEPEQRAGTSTPLRDLAGLLRSFSYASQAAFLAVAAGQRLLPEQQEAIGFIAESFARRAGQYAGRQYGTWIARLAPSLIPANPVVYLDLLDLCRLEKVLYELQYELANRPEWVVIPLTGLRQLINERAAAGLSGR